MSPIMPMPPNTKGTLSKRILVVDDDPGVLFLIRARLQGEGFLLETAATAEQALDRIAVQGLPDLAVIDIRLPGMNGLELAKLLRQKSDLPIILLSAVDDEETVADSLEQFAQDYVRKPFFPRELMARIRRHLDRVSPTHEGRYVIDDRVTIDLVNLELSVEGHAELLTPTETKLLRILLEKEGEAVSPQDLLDQIWFGGAVGESALRVNIYRLRQKIEIDPQHPRYLVTRRSQGYAFITDAQA